MQPLILTVPCFNEAQRLPRQQLSEALGRYRWLQLYFVDDGSTDATRELLQQLQRAHPDRSRVLTLDRNSGKGAAVRHGMAAACAAGAPLVGYWDADLSAPLSELPAMRQLLLDRPVDAVFGSRVRLLGRDIKRSTARHYLGRVFATATSLSLGLPVYDTQCGAKLFRNTPVLVETLQRPFDARWIFDVELLARYMVAVGRDNIEAHIAEHPLSQWHAAPGSRLRPWHFLQAARDLARVVHQTRSASR